VGRGLAVRGIGKESAPHPGLPPHRGEGKKTTPLSVTAVGWVQPINTVIFLITGVTWCFISMGWRPHRPTDDFFKIIDNRQKALRLNESKRRLKEMFFIFNQLFFCFYPEQGFAIGGCC